MPCMYRELICLRNTPIGALHRVIWIHIPSSFRSLDQRISRGRLSAWTLKTAHTLWNDRHPIVMVHHNPFPAVYTYQILVIPIESPV